MNIAEKYKPANGFTHVLHHTLLVLYPLVLYVFVRTGFIQLALVLIVLSKWRIFAVRPRFWLANLRANSVDIIVGLAVLTFMAQTGSGLWQFIWAAAYAGWLLFIKPRTTLTWNSLQAAIGQAAGLTALYLAWDSGPLYGLVPLTGLICYLSARHFFDRFDDESHSRLLAYLWGYFGAALMWVLGHWLLFFGAIAQPAVLLVVIGGGLGGLYHLHARDAASRLMRRQIMFTMLAIVVLVLALSDWSSAIV